MIGPRLRSPRLPADSETRKLLGIRARCRTEPRESSIDRSAMRVRLARAAGSSTRLERAIATLSRDMRVQLLRFLPDGTCLATLSCGSGISRPAGTPSARHASRKPWPRCLHSSSWNAGSAHDRADRKSEDVPCAIRIGCSLVSVSSLSRLFSVRRLPAPVVEPLAHGHLPVRLIRSPVQHLRPGPAHCLSSR